MSEEGMRYAKPLPKIRPMDRPYWEGTRLSELRLQRCGSCGTYRHPPSAFCQSCLSDDYTWEQASGGGVIWGRIFMHRVYFKGFADEVPYNIVWVALDEGPMITSAIIGAAHDDIQVNRRVTVAFDQATDEITFPKFRLA